ncbi:hypothetical protein M404DRAFT_23262 [Pisolithus tinctorius Marx 270]|uniref:Uncharacterized protein n=1 Tax=Pisolithus tinctorius Marx 270 TaxID=870435 RepID=A0A0C3PIS1_PISTI|nr:hypothetical protein M404DRAFT_23262 [Pisolithus tinctorius Marx 270]
MGPRVLGSLDIIVRPRVTPSWRHRFTRSFPLAPHTTFDQLLKSVTSRGMMPFYFQQVGFARFGCRDAISQFAAAWSTDGLLLDLLCRENPRTHIYQLLGRRYSWPTVTGAVTTSDEEEEEEGVVRTTRGFSTAQSYIQRGVWPKEYEHVEHPLLEFTSRPDA